LCRGSNMKRISMLPLLLSALVIGSVRTDDVGYHENYEPSPYHYEYKVNDPKEYLDFGAEEEGDGKGDVHGQYHVQLPDGRLQHVSYHVDDYNGYIADVSYDGHAEHPSHHGGHHHGVGIGGVSHGGVGGGHRFGKALIQDTGVSSPVAPKSSEDVKSREGKQFNSPPQSLGIHPNDLSGSFGRFDNKIIQPTNSFFSKQPTIPVKQIEPSTDFNHRFGEPSIQKDFSGSFGSSPNSLGSVASEPRKPSNSFFSRRPIEPQQSSPIPIPTPSKPFQTPIQPSPKPFSTFGNNPSRIENSFFSGGRAQQHQEPNLPPRKVVNDSPIRRGKSGKQDFDGSSSNLFGSSSQSKPIVHSGPVAEKIVTNSKVPFESKFGAPKTNSFFGSVEKSHERHERPKDFDSFSPIFGKSSSNNGFSNQPKKSFDSFSPIFGKESNKKDFSGKIKTISSEPIKEDADFFKPSGPVRPLESVQKTNKPVNSGFPSRTITNTFSSQVGKQSFPARQSVAPPAKFTKQPLTKTVAAHDQPKQQSPRFKPRPIGFGNNHPVLQRLKEHRQNALRDSSIRKESVDRQSGFSGQGSFRTQGNRQQFGRALKEESVRDNSSNQQKAQELKSDRQGQKAFITHKALPV